MPSSAASSASTGARASSTDRRVRVPRCRSEMTRVRTGAQVSPFGRVGAHMTDLSRRELLGAGAALGAGVVLGTAPAGAATRRATRRRPTVAVLGGGMAGLTAAHELIDRGFDVTVYERNALGGKARSIPTPGTGRGGRRDLPGEHGFRFFPGFYHHIPDSMRRTPYPGNANGVWDNLTAASLPRSPRTNGRPDAQLFGIVPDPQEAAKPGGMQRLLEEAATQKGISPVEASTSRSGS